MKYLPLIRAGLTRSRVRTALTISSVVAAFLLFGLLDSVRVAFESSANVAGHDRLVVASRTSIMHHLPQSLGSRILEIPGVDKVAHNTWFGGIYRDEKNFFPSFAVDPALFSLYPEYEIDRAQLEAFREKRTGAVVGAMLAEKHGWKIGDTIPLQAAGFPTRGSNDWAFTLVGIFKLKDPTRIAEENQLMFQWDYFEEANDYFKGSVGWYTVKLRPGADADRVASAIDALSRNSDHETKTQTEQAFSQGFLKQFADIGLIVSSIMAAVFFTLLLLTGNTMAQSVRERTSELAVLKAVGFTDGAVMAIVLFESVLQIVLGGVIGLLLAAMLMPALGAASGGAIQMQSIAGVTWLVGLALMVAIGAIVGFLPGRRALRLKIVDALAGR